MSDSKTYVLCLDLEDDREKIDAYVEYHKPENVWPEITRSIKDSGILKMDIYQTGNRLVMVIEAELSFTFEDKAQRDSNNPHVQQWEALMSDYQQRLPWTPSDQKWQLMTRIFDLPDEP